jgi:hypothetical protein
MFRLHNLFRFQYFLALAALVESLFFFLVYRPMADKSVRLNREVNEAWKKLVDINLGNHFRLGMDLETVSHNLLVADKSIASLKRACARLQDELQFDEATVDQLRRPFQLLDYEQRRFQVLDELTRLAAANKVALDPPALGGLPEFSPSQEQPSTLWAELAAAHRLMSLAISNKVAIIKALHRLPTRLHHAPQSEDVIFEEYLLHVELTGSMDSVLQTLMRLSGPSLGPDFIGPRLRPSPALFMDRLILKSVPGSPDLVAMDAIITAFLNRTNVFETAHAASLP